MLLAVVWTAMIPVAILTGWLYSLAFISAASLYAINASAIAVLFGAVWAYVLTHTHLLAPDVDRQAALRAWPRFSVGSIVYLACIPLGLFSPIAVVIVCAALAVYYAFERLPDITRQPAAGARRQP